MCGNGPKIEEQKHKNDPKTKAQKHENDPKIKNTKIERMIQVKPSFKNTKCPRLDKKMNTQKCENDLG